MKINKRKLGNRKRIVIITILILLLLAAVLTYAFFTQSNKGKSADTVQPSDSTAQQKDDQPENPDTKPSTSNTDSSEPVKTGDENSKAIVSMTASASTSGGTVYIRGGIDNAVVSDGICYAQLSGPSGESVKKDTTLLQNPSTTDCKTISINAVDLTKGTWTVKLYYSSESMEGVSNEATFEIT